MNSEDAPEERFEPVSRRSCRNDRSIEASSESAETRGMTGRKPSRAEEDRREKSLSTDLHFDKKSRGKFSPISVLSYLIL